MHSEASFTRGWVSVRPSEVASPHFTDRADQFPDIPTAGSFLTGPRSLARFEVSAVLAPVQQRRCSLEECTSARAAQKPKFCQT